MHGIIKAIKKSYWLSIISRISFITGTSRGASRTSVSNSSMCTRFTTKPWWTFLAWITDRTRGTYSSLLRKDLQLTRIQIYFENTTLWNLIYENLKNIISLAILGWGIWHHYLVNKPCFSKLAGIFRHVHWSKICFGLLSYWFKPIRYHYRFILATGLVWIANLRKFGPNCIWTSPNCACLGISLICLTHILCVRKAILVWCDG